MCSVFCQYRTFALQPWGLQPCSAQPVACSLAACSRTACSVQPCNLQPRNLQPCSLATCSLAALQPATLHALALPNLTPAILQPCSLQPCSCNLRLLRLGSAALAGGLEIHIRTSVLMSVGRGAGANRTCWVMKLRGNQRTFLQRSNTINNKMVADAKLT